MENARDLSSLSLVGGLCLFGVYNFSFVSRNTSKPFAARETVGNGWGIPPDRCNMGEGNGTLNLAMEGGHWQGHTFDTVTARMEKPQFYGLKPTSTSI